MLVVEEFRDSVFISNPMMIMMMKTTTTLFTVKQENKEKDVWLGHMRLRRMLSR